MVWLITVCEAPLAGSRRTGPRDYASVQHDTDKLRLIELRVVLKPKGPCAQIVYTLALKYSLYGYIGPKVYTIWVHGPLGEYSTDKLWFTTPPPMIPTRTLLAEGRV